MHWDPVWPVAQLSGSAGTEEGGKAERWNKLLLFIILMIEQS